MDIKNYLQFEDHREDLFRFRRIRSSRWEGKSTKKSCKPARKELQIGEGGHKSRGSCCGRGCPPVRVCEMRRCGLDGWMRDAASRGGWGDGRMRRAAAASGASLLPARGSGGLRAWTGSDADAPPSSSTRGLVLRRGQVLRRSRG
jgi:hypothetical protein